MATPRLAAIVVAFNRSSKLRECLESLLAQTLPNLEVVVVDNASTDDTAEMVSTTFGDRVRLVRRETNGGYAAGANTGWRSTSAEYVAILNQDLTLAPDCLERMLETLQGAPGEALVSPKLVMASDPEVVNTIGNDVHLSGVAWCRELGSRSADWRGIEEVPAVSGAAILARREFLETLGGLEEAYFMYYEDVDLSVRARLAGARCLVACDAVALHDWALGLSPWKFALLERNRRAFWGRLWGGRPRMLPVLWQAEAMAWAFAVLRGREYIDAKRSVGLRPLLLGPLDADQRQPGTLSLRDCLARRHPYKVLFPGAGVVSLLGGMVDRVATAFTR